MAKINGIGHIGICVKDMEKQIEFYTSVMGFKVFDGPTDPINEEGESKGMGFENCIDRVCMLKAPDGTTFEFMQFIEPEPYPVVRVMNAIGKHHVSFEVDDIFELTEEFRKKGLDVLYKPQLAPGVENSYYWAIVRDPEGIVLEFCQYI